MAATVKQQLKEALAKVSVLVDQIDAEPLPSEWDEQPPTPSETYFAKWYESGLTDAQLINWTVNGETYGGFVMAAWGDESWIVTQGSRRWTENPVEKVWSKVPSGSDLSKVIKDGGRYVLEGNCTMSSYIQVKDVGLRGNGYRVTVTADTQVPNWQTLFRTGGHCAFHDLTFIQPREWAPGWYDKSNTPMLFHPLQGSMLTVHNVIGDGFSWFINCNMKPSGVLLESCVGYNIRNYFAWVEGYNIVINHCACEDTIYEHTIRGGPSGNSEKYGWNGLTLNYNIFKQDEWDLRDAAGNLYNDKKGTVVMQAGTRGYRYKNIVLGNHGIGPLEMQTGSPELQRTSHVVIDGDTVDQPFELRRGVEDVLTSVAWEPKIYANDTRPMPKDVRKL